MPIQTKIQIANLKLRWRWIQKRAPSFIGFPLFPSDGGNTGPHSWGRMFRLSGERGIPYTTDILASLGFFFFFLQSPLKLLNQHGKSILGLTAKLLIRGILCNISNRNNIKSSMSISSLKEGILLNEISLTYFTYKYGRTIEILISENLTAQQICMKKPFILIPQAFLILAGWIIIRSRKDILHRWKQKTAEKEVISRSPLYLKEKPTKLLRTLQLAVQSHELLIVFLKL